MLVDIAPIKKNPIKSQIILSMKINGDIACPVLTISVRGSKGSNFFKSNNMIIYAFNKSLQSIKALSLKKLKIHRKNFIRVSNTKSSQQCYLQIVIL